METNDKTLATPDIRTKISILWIVVMFNMVYADIVGFLNPGTLEQMMAMKPSQELLLVFSILIEIPIAMIFLSRILKPKVNGMVNIGASAITILWIIGGGTLSASYIFFASIEVISMLAIIRYSLKLTK